MFGFDEQDTIEDFLANEDVCLTDKKWRFKERVNTLMKKGRTRSQAEQIVENVIRTKETSKRCACGKVAQVFDPESKQQLYCGECPNGKF